MASDCKVFIGGLSPATTRETLLQQMSMYGEIKDCKVVVDQQTGKSKGYGFVVYTTPQQAEASVKQGFVLIDGKNCNCNLASLRKKEKTEGLAMFPTDMSYDRSHTDMMHMGTPAYLTPIPMDPQMHMSASLQSLYAELQTLKYEVTVINQNVLQLKQTIGLMKNGLDALLQRNGIIIPAYPQ
eukprot:TRINITY_DN304_c0_g1_i15.p1 TRINITY_DN304_c0_g1~~TRINITY_DN304_c0_g1_i15.p1  ORF type:complete len:183 (-),score=33.57 TRINITY_DN304_c0_g1_i15:573-1121(-)